MTHRYFFPQMTLDTWLVDERIDLRGTELTLLRESRKYNLAEAVHVVTEVSGSPDAFDLLGRVKSREALIDQGADVLENSMILGDNAYDIVPGWFGDPVGDFASFVDSRERQLARALHTDFPAAEPETEDELLVRFAARAKS
jgi:hypothetical protein